MHKSEKLVTGDDGRRGYPSEAAVAGLPVTEQFMLLRCSQMLAEALAESDDPHIVLDFGGIDGSSSN